MGDRKEIFEPPATVPSQGPPPVDRGVTPISRRCSCLVRGLDWKIAEEGVGGTAGSPHSAFPKCTLEGCSLGKVVLLLIILLGASLYFPQTRPVVVDTLAPVMNPFLIWQTQGEMDRIGRELQSLNRRGSELPSSGASFHTWMGQTFYGPERMDAWGVDYTLKIWLDSIGLVSNGPDMEIGTDDDLVLTALIQRRRRSR